MAIFPKPDFYGQTDPGKVRVENEDQFLIAELSKSMLVHQTSLPTPDSTRLAGPRPGYLFLVADGLSGSPGGERASRLAVDQVIRSVLGTMPWFFRLEEYEEELEQELKSLFEKCQRKIDADARENPSRSGMGTTMTMAYLLWPSLYIVHVGDARAYLLRAGTLEQLTRDHTIQAPAAGAGASKSRTLLWNVLGGETGEVWPDVHKTTLVEGDVLLLATDGLWREVPEEVVSSILKGTSSAQEAGQALVCQANDRGGRDNVSVVVARFGTRPTAQEDPHLAGAQALEAESQPSAGAALDPAARSLPRPESAGDTVPGSEPLVSNR